MKLKTFQTTEIQIRSVCVSVHTRVIEFCLSSKKIYVKLPMCQN